MTTGLTAGLTMPPAPPALPGTTGTPPGTTPGAGAGNETTGDPELAWATTGGETGDLVPELPGEGGKKELEAGKARGGRIGGGRIGTPDSKIFKILTNGLTINSSLCLNTI